jgi:hypothetical protein
MKDDVYSSDVTCFKVYVVLHPTWLRGLYKTAIILKVVGVIASAAELIA